MSSSQRERNRSHLQSVDPYLLELIDQCRETFQAKVEYVQTPQMEVGEPIHYQWPQPMQRSDVQPMYVILDVWKPWRRR